MSKSLGPSQVDPLKRQASLVSLVGNLCLTIIKTAAAVLTGSLSLISESIHSAIDLVASIVTFISVRAAALPPDEEHPYGHGKIESLAGFGEAIFLLMVVLYIVVESVERLIHGCQVRHLNVGIWIMAVSAAVSFGGGFYMRRVASKTESMALQSNARHQLIDFATSVGVLLALATAKLTGWQQADAYFALGLAVWIAFNAYVIGRECAEQLIDRRVTDEDLQQIIAILESGDGMLSYHHLRSRHSGNVHYVDVHIVVPNTWTVVQGHNLADSLEKQIQATLTPAQVVIHIDPYDEQKALGRK